MAATDFVVPFNASTFFYESPSMAAKKVIGVRRKRIRDIAKLLRAQQTDDAKPSPKKPKIPKVKVFDQTVADFATALGLILTRCDALLS